jgi:alkylated DNA repair dioxygenase AlkB
MVLSKASRIQNLSNLPTLGPGDSIGEGDSYIVHDLIPDQAVLDNIFESLKAEVEWQKMYHAAGEVPRLVAVQGLIAEDGSKPVYRHPADQSPPLKQFTKAVDVVRKEAEKNVGHELNHVLIQLYRDGKDHITEHSDKTLDIVKGTKIVNASFGARRTMRLRGKRKSALQVTGQSDTSTTEAVQESKTKSPIVLRTRDTQRVHMPHNSLFVLGPLTNTNWLHGISADKRLPADRDSSELEFDSARISLTFRKIGTFLDADETKIWGQGAVHKQKEEASEVIVGNEAETERMIRSFGKENREDIDSGWNWDETYGGGFDVLHFRG